MLCACERSVVVDGFSCLGTRDACKVQRVREQSDNEMQAKQHHCAPGANSHVSESIRRLLVGPTIPLKLAFSVNTSRLLNGRTMMRSDLGAISKARFCGPLQS